MLPTRQPDTPPFQVAQTMFRRAKTRKQLKCPSTGEQIKTWYIYAMEYYSAIKNNEIMPFATTWMALESVILNEASQRRRTITQHPLYVESKR